MNDFADESNITSALRDIVKLAKDGDVIVLPQGKFIVDGTIDLTGKDISIIGRGADTLTGTMLYRNSVSNSDWFFRYSNPKSDFSSLYFISGIYFKSIITETLNNGILFDRTTNWIASDNIMENINTFSIKAVHLDYIVAFNGLIFKNKIIDPYNPVIHNYGYGTGSEAQDATWIKDPEFGSNKFVFIEDNYFFKSRHAVAAGAGGKYVFRYNTIRDNWQTSAIDMHGGGEWSKITSARAAEIYNNDIETSIDSYGKVINGSTPTDHYVPAIGIRGGEALIYNNKVGNYLSYIELSLEETTPPAYPSPFQIGYLSGTKYGIGDSGIETEHGNGDVFWWNPVWIQKYSGWDTIDVRSEDKTYIIKGRDFHNLQKPGYTPFTYPHPYRNYYYTFIDTFINNINTPYSTKIIAGSITLTWNDIIGEDGYYIYESSNGTIFTKIDSTALNVSTITISNLSTEPHYFYIKAYNDTHEGMASGILNTSIAIPTFQNSVVENNAPAILEITYNLTLAKILPLTSAFTVKVNSVARNISSIAISGDKVILNLTNPIVFGDVVTVAYTRPAINPLQTPAGGEAITISEQTATNRVGFINTTLEPIIIIYPNPVQKNMNISIFGGTTLTLYVIRIINLSGIIVYEKKNNQDVFDLQIPINLINGVYFIKIELSDHSWFTQKIVVHN